jgi:hypothetical protein
VRRLLEDIVMGIEPDYVDVFLDTIIEDLYKEVWANPKYKMRKLDELLIERIIEKEHDT